MKEESKTRLIKGKAFELFMNSVGSQLLQSTAVLVSDHGSNQFSGTFITYGSNKYLVTARHCLKDVVDFKTLQIGTRGNNFGENLPNPKIRYLDHVDLGLIEIPDDVLDRLKCKPESFQTIDSNSAGSGTDIYVVGFPSYLFEEGQNIFHPRPFFYRSKVSERWPIDKVDFDHVRPEKHFFVEWDENNTMNLHKNKIDPFPLRGISGAGLFTIVPALESSIIWDFTQLRLAGFISSVNTNTRLIRCVRAEYVLRLLGATLEFRLTDS